MQGRPKSMTFINSYLHDCLASAISLKGADHTHIEGNVIERAGYRGIGVGFDPYWWEVRDPDLFPKPTSPAILFLVNV